MKRLNITFLSIISGVKFTLLFVLGYYLFVFLIFRDIGIFEVWYVHVWPLITVLPDIFIITGFIVEDFNKKISIGHQCIIDEKVGKKYASEEIRKIVIHKTNLKSYKTMSFMYFQYAEIILKNNDKILITSLMKSNLDEFLKENVKGVYYDYDYNNFL